MQVRTYGFRLHVVQGGIPRPWLYTEQSADMLQSEQPTGQVCIIPVVGAPMQARLHVVSVHSSIGTPHKPIVPTLAHSHCSHWGRSLMISIRVAVCLALLGCWGLEDVLP